MKVSINCKECEFQDGVKFVEVVNFIREMKRSEPMIKTIREKTGKDPLLFVLNGRVIRPQQYDSIEIKEGDDIRYIHPFAGG